MPPRDEAAKPEAPAAPVFAVQTTLETAPAEPEQTAIEPEPVIPWRIAGEVLDTYIICEDAEKTVWLIDKHAAHERVNFDRFKANLEPIMSQELLTPWSRSSPRRSTPRLFRAASRCCASSALPARSSATARF